MTLLHIHRPGRFRAVDASRPYDPTGTTAIRARYERDLVRRFRQLRIGVLKAVGRDDVLGLSPIKDALPKLMLIRDAIQTPPPKAFQFLRKDAKVSSFMGWLRQAEDDGILAVQQGTPIEMAAQQSWQNTYIDTAYQKGIRDAGAKLKKAKKQAGPFIGQFNAPIHADAVGLIYTRAFNDLDGITKAMDTQISRVLAQGLAEGRGPMDVARKLADRVDKIGVTRARVIARTEIINAHAEASLNMFEEAGVIGVEVEAELATAGDEAVCEECEALEGQVYSIEEARGLIPVHPNCRCAFLPVVG